MRVLIHAHALGRVRVLGHVLGLGPGPHGIAEGMILTSLPGMAEGVEVGLGLVEEAEEARVVDTVQVQGLVLLYVAGLLGLRAGGHQVTSVGATEGVERGRLRILCVPVAHERDLILVPALHVLVRGPALSLTLPTQDTVGAGAGVVRVLGL